MRYDEVSENLKSLAYDFFFYFSRFEAALKEQGYLKCKKVGAPRRLAGADFQKRTDKILN